MTRSAHDDLKLWIPGVPAPQGSKRAFRHRGRVVLVESSRKLPAWRHLVATVAAADCPQPIAGAVAVQLVFVMPRTKAMRNRPAPPMTQRPDIDKLTRAALDGLTGPVLVDDSHVVEIHVVKRRARPAEPTGMRVTVRPVEATEPPTPSRSAGEGQTPAAGPK